MALPKRNYNILLGLPPVCLDITTFFHHMVLWPILISSTSTGCQVLSNKGSNDTDDPYIPGCSPWKPYKSLSLHSSPTCQQSAIAIFILPITQGVGFLGFIMIKDKLSWAARKSCPLLRSQYIGHYSNFLTYLSSNDFIAHIQLLNKTLAVSAGFFYNTKIKSCKKLYWSTLFVN